MRRCSMMRSASTASTCRPMVIGCVVMTSRATALEQVGARRHVPPQVAVGHDAVQLPSLSSTHVMPSRLRDIS